MKKLNEVCFQAILTSVDQQDLIFFNSLASASKVELFLFGPKTESQTEMDSREEAGLIMSINLFLFLSFFIILSFQKSVKQAKF